MRFFVGVKEEEVTPKQNANDSASYYAWCLEEAIPHLRNAQNDQEKRNALARF